MKNITLIIGLCVSALLFSSAAQAGHERSGYQGKSKSHHHQGHHHKDRGKQHPGSRKVVIHSHQPSYHTARRHSSHRSPPPIKTMRHHVHQKRHHIGRGDPRPTHVIIVKGKPIPHGWGKRLHHNQARHLPHYPGYEWRRVGRDMVLVVVATGIVYAILDNVL
ncbi:MAG: anti-virulence regulator CigR family protein [Pseudomonas sp.]